MEKMKKKRGKFVLLVLVSFIFFSLLAVSFVSAACPVGVDNGDGTCTVVIDSTKSGYVTRNGQWKSFSDLTNPYARMQFDTSDTQGDFQEGGESDAHYEWFDVSGIPAGTTINSAVFYKYNYAIHNNVYRADIYKVNEDWDETTSYNTNGHFPYVDTVFHNYYFQDEVCKSPTCDPADLVLIYGDGPTTDGPYMRALVLGWVSGSMPNYGVAFYGWWYSDSTKDFYFRTAPPGYKPKLVVTYKLPECVAGTTQACNTGQLGICAAGTQTCLIGRTWGSCIRNNNPSSEICNDNLDNDCDGFIDCLDSNCLAAPNCVQTSFNYAKWTRAGVEISIISNNTNVNMTVKGVNLQNNEKIRFRIYENETNGNIYITEINSTISNNEANAEWLAIWIDDGLGQGDPEFYFTAVLVSNSDINITSGLLSIPEGCVDKTCSEISATEGKEVCGSWDNGCGGSVDCTCSIGDCVKGLDGSGNELAYGYCEITATVINCSDYNVLNFGSEENAEGNCTEYSENVAKYTIEVERDEGSGFCGSQEPDTGCTRECSCYWDSANSECKGDWERVSCNDPGDEGVCMLTGAVVLKECEENPAGTRILNQTFEWTGTGTRPDECLASNVVNLKCLSKIALDFFDNINLIIAILIIVLFYIIVWRSRKSRISDDYQNSKRILKKRENLKKEKIKRKKR